MDIRVGLGHDTHRLEEGRPLILGGVTITHSHGLAGHSDGDIVLHALTDAILGAIGAGDIGDHYPDTDSLWKGANSRLFLEGAMARMQGLGFEVINADIIIHAQNPKLGPSKDLIKNQVASFLGVDPQRVNIKAKTGEKVGHIGRIEAMACQAVVLLQKDFGGRDHGA
ncbi:MAG: 2-C-methyl-D-erythritol 2,4-cyclodiphosphate synthase [Gemmataceae bacterium]